MSVFSKKAKTRPEIEKSDMYRAFMFLKINADVWVENANWNYKKDTSITFGVSEESPEAQLGLSRNDVDIAYSQEAQALRITVPKFDLSVVQKYNEWSEEEGEYADYGYARKLSEANRVGLGTQFSVSYEDGTKGSFSLEPFKKDLNNRQLQVLATANEVLNAVHSAPTSGIVKTTPYEGLNRNYFKYVFDEPSKDKEPDYER